MLKRNNICLPGNNSTLQSTSTHETGIFTWATVQKFYNSLPCEVCHCENAEDAKQYTKAGLIILSAFIIAGMYDNFMKGGLL